jgi:transposase InsO family protein
VTRIRYLGHIISDKGLEKDPEKVKALIEAPEPTNVDELRSLLGLINYYSNFIPQAAKVLYPLNNLLKKNSEFQWSDRCRKALQHIKTELVSERVLVTYNPDLPLILETDASPFGLSAILSHELNGQRRPITFISRSLTNAEKSYSHLDKEATAIFWATKKLFQYIYGRSFTLVTNNLPLRTIFNPEKNLPSITTLRLTRYALWLRQFDYIIQHRAGKLHQHVDYFSRAPLQTTDVAYQDEEYGVGVETINLLTSDHTVPITMKTPKEETLKDKQLSELKRELENGTGNNFEYSLHQGIIMRGCRVVIPESLQKYVLRELHATHSGIVKMKALARTTCFWKNIDRDIETMCKECLPCALLKSNPAKVPIHVWEPPTGVWQRIHINFAGPENGRQFLIVVDAYSKWMEIEIFNSSPTSESTIEVLKKLYTTHGLPNILVSDNAPIFKSEVFEDFCRLLGTSHRTSASYHPSTNGQAERMIQTFKRKLKALTYSDLKDLTRKVNQILFQHRVTPLECGKSPSELHVGRMLHSKLHIINPKYNLPEKRTSTSKKNIRTLRKGQRVVSRNYVGPQKWNLGTVIEVLGSLTYHICLDNGCVIKRHIDQLREADMVRTPNHEPSSLSVEQSKKPAKLVRFVLPPNQPTSAMATAESRTSATQPQRQPIQRSTRTKKPPNRLNL